MTNKEFKKLLQQYPDDYPVKIMTTHEPVPIAGMNAHKFVDPIAFTDENIMLTSETAYIDFEAPEAEWDTEDGKVELGEGQKYLLVNPIIL